MDLKVNDIVMIVNVKNKKVVYIETISCAYRGTFSTSIFNISKNLEIIYCNRPNDKEEYKVVKVWRFNKEKDDLIIIYPEHEKEEPAKTETETNKETYIDFTFAPYALADILYALDNSGIKNFAITKEDNDLHIRIPKSYLKHIIKI